MKSFHILALFSVLVLLSCSSTFSEEEKQTYIAKGDEISQRTFTALSSELMTQMKAGGPVEAVSFCNVHVLPLTDTLSKEGGVVIKRTSDKIRNTANRTTPRELEVIISYKAQLDLGKELKPIVEKRGEQVYYYAPIKVKAACLSCHGNANQISKPVDSVLALKYAKDMAVNYKEGELRGIWSISFENKSKE